MISKFSVRDNEKLISNIVKVYPHMTKIIIYHNSYKIYFGVEKNRDDSDKTEVSKISKITKNLNDNRSLRRTKTLVKDIILCNHFDYFCTFTFDKRKHNRYDVDHCKHVMHMWLHRQREKSPDLKYLVVPELHKDGALHFHSLFKSYNGYLKKLNIKTKSGRDMYNISSWRAGRISSAVPITDNPEAVANYVLKQYLIKDMPLFSGKKRYWCSQNLKRPETTVNGVEEFGLGKIVKNTKPDYINDNYEIQYHASRGSKIDSKDLLLDLPF